MKFVSLKKAIEITTKFLGPVKVQPEAPQFDSLEEAATNAGGEDKLLERVNKSVRDDVKSKVRAYLTNLTEGTTLEVATARALEIGKNYNLRTSAKIPVAARASAADAITEMLSQNTDPNKTYTAAEIQALFDAQIKRAMEEAEEKSSKKEEKSEPVSETAQ